MTREEAIREACSVVALAYNSIEDYSEPSDCFCSRNAIPDRYYANAGKAIEYVKRAVIEKLERDGYTVKET